MILKTALGIDRPGRGSYLIDLTCLEHWTQGGADAHKVTAGAREAVEIAAERDAGGDNQDCGYSNH